MKVIHYLTMAVLISAAGAMTAPVYAEGDNKSDTRKNNRTENSRTYDRENIEHDSRYDNRNNRYNNDRVTHQTRRDPRTLGSAQRGSNATINSDQPNTYHSMHHYDNRDNHMRSHYNRNNGYTTTSGAQRGTR